MRAVIQRVSQASVTADREIIGEIGAGLLVLLGIGPGDGPDQVNLLTDKLVGLRIFSDAAGRMNLSLLDMKGGVLVVSQFTLYADCRKGRRPSFTNAATPQIAAPLVELFAVVLHQKGIRVATGRFGAHMEVSLINDGPVTLFLDTAELGGR